ncbi:MAG: pyruvate dehydrogenase component alpha subunit [Acidimicrobiaceae bacterium]|nr:pyruvate dehydrogenase component alpha subunit [Acidimicrobiaceae bacterium]
MSSPVLPDKTEVMPDAVARRLALTNDEAIKFARMVEIRLIEDRVIALFGEGLIPGTTHTCQGQEAVAVGIAGATRPDDIVVCTYRGHGMALALGVTPEAVLGEILGRQIGCMGGIGGSMHLSDSSVGLLPTFAIVGAGVPVAAGSALTSQVLGLDNISISVFGDGSVNIGGFHEGLNLAAIWRLPVVFVCENNLYGEYSRIDRTTPIEDLALRAAGYAIPSETVDGQDVDAVHSVIERAANRAREGGGPTFVEAKTYRYAGHSRSDKAAYRPAGELDAWLRRDPVRLYGEKLIANGTLDERAIERIWSEQREELEATLERVLASPRASTADMFSRVQASGD